MMFDRFNKMMDEAKSSIADAAVKMKGKTEGMFIPPETRIEETRTGKRIYFRCTKCHKEFGPVDMAEWDEKLEHVHQGVAVASGVIQMSPTKVAGSCAGITMGKKDDPTFLDKYVLDHANKEEAEKLLIQCDYCGKFFCSSCWHPERNRCVDCAVKKDPTLDEVMAGAKEKLVDSTLRAHGKAKGLFEKPETRTKDSFFKTKTYFICSTCKAEVGPFEESKVKKALDEMWNGTKVMYGVITANPLKAAGGSYGLAKMGLGNKTDSGFAGQLSEDSSRGRDSKTMLIQCEYCGKYQCSSCWDEKKDCCVNCSKKSPKELLF